MRTIQVQLTVVVPYEVNDDMTDDQIQFFIEENHCISNVIEKLAADVAADSARNVCNVCAHGSAKWLKDGA